MLIMIKSADMQPAMAVVAVFRPWRALMLMIRSMLGPGVAETTKVIKINNHQVLRVMC
jgi:hypothetical protein